jgi:hypothetical protein
MSRTRKRPYTKSKRFDASCRCHGSCGYCRSNRLHFDRKNRTAAEEQLRDYRCAV